VGILTIHFGGLENFARALGAEVPATFLILKGLSEAVSIFLSQLFRLFTKINTVRMMEFFQN
jgi:hypothetical protein